MTKPQLSLTIDGKHEHIDQLRFSGGEMQIRILAEPSDVAHAIVVVSHVRSSDDLLATLLTRDACRHHFPNARIRLVCPYLPYARQDRVAYPGEAFSLHVTARLLATQFDAIEVWDVHSAVAANLIPGLVNVPASAFLRGRIASNTVIVAPDKGALPRARDVATQANATLVVAEKMRDTNTGAISHTVVHTGHLGERDCLIVDDICDGGRTFVELARVLRTKTRGTISLYVTHGIFSKGFDALYEAGITTIYTANSFIAAAELPRWVTVLEKEHD